MLLGTIDFKLPGTLKKLSLSGKLNGMFPEFLENTQMGSCDLKQTLICAGPNYRRNCGNLPACGKRNLVINLMDEKEAEIYPVDECQALVEMLSLFEPIMESPSPNCCHWNIVKCAEQGFFKRTSHVIDLFLLGLEIEGSFENFSFKRLPMLENIILPTNGGIHGFFPDISFLPLRKL